MKITLDVRKAVQVYDFQTKTQTNVLVIELGGTEIELELSETQLEAAIKEAHELQEDGTVEAPEVPEYEDEPEPVTASPQTFVHDDDPSVGVSASERVELPEELPETPFEDIEEPPTRNIEEPGHKQHRRIRAKAKQDAKPVVRPAKEQLRILRDRARKLPPRRVPMDDFGNPIVEPQQPRRSVPGPEVRTAAGPGDAGDEDGFQSA